jgi:hypothetical protein
LVALGVALALTLIGTAAAIAGNMHFSGGGGSWNSPLTFEGVLVGLGSQLNVTVTATAFGTAPAECTNKGGNIAPGIKPLSVSGSAQGFWTFDENGRAAGSTGFITPTLPDPPPTWKQAGCPNRNWKVTGVVANRVDWDSVYAEAVAEDGSIDAINLVCTTSYRSDGTTFGECVEASG